MMPEPVVAGCCAPRFEGLRAALQANIAAGTELGASIVVDLGGERIVNLWGGFADRDRTIAWQADTVVNLWSISKLITNLAALMLIDRGLLDHRRPVADYWPEFAGNGKGDVTVEQVLAHSSGVAGWEPPFSVEQMLDVPRATQALATQAPWWRPGSGSGYHAQNQGHLVGELVRRVSGQRLSAFVDSEIAVPLAADIRIGANGVVASRIAQLEPPPPARIHMPPDFDPTVMKKVFTAPPLDAMAAETPAWRAAELGALNAHGNARSVATTLSILTLGGRRGPVELLSEKVAGLPLIEQSDGLDRGLALPLRWGLGYALPRRGLDLGIPPGRRGFWGGWGGSMVVVDPENAMTFAYVMNKMSPGIIGSDRSRQYVDATYAALLS